MRITLNLPNLGHLLAINVINVQRATPDAVFFSFRHPNDVAGQSVQKICRNQHRYTSSASFTSWHLVESVSSLLQQPPDVLRQQHGSCLVLQLTEVVEIPREHGEGGLVGIRPYNGQHLLESKGAFLQDASNLGSRYVISATKDKRYIFLTGDLFLF